MKNYKVLIKTKSKKYTIIIGKNILTKIKNYFINEKIYYNKCLIVVDTKISKTSLNKVKKNFNKKDCIVYNFVSNEKNKNLNSVNKIINLLFKNNFSRDDCLISLGGGITGDVVGFAASIYKRGLKFINIPTTLLSQVDSSIGGKTGINNIYGKNLIGSFYQPDLVISDISTLKTLPDREIICGYGELLKHSLIKSKKNFNYLNNFNKQIIKLKTPYIEKAIFESCKIKKSIVEKDEKESGLRKILNFGHTFAHAYEATLGFSKKLNHGEAVLIGIVSALRFSLKNRFLKHQKFNKIIKHIEGLNLDLYLKKFFKLKDLKKIVDYMKMDKKNNTSKINLILIKDIGKPIINKKFHPKKIHQFIKYELL